MKILTLNAHSLSEKNQNLKIDQTAEFIKKNEIDVILLQEVCQSIYKEKVTSNQWYTGEENLKEDNYALNLSNALNGYYWTWIPIKLGFGRFEEGIAILSKNPILNKEDFVISKAQNFINWRKRAVLGIQNKDGWFYTAHTGWWHDIEEPFINQWEIIQKRLSQKSELVFIGGDFNAPSNVPGQSYATILNSGWKDTYFLSKEKNGHDTMGGDIIGWKSKAIESARIDYIFVNQSIEVLSSTIVLNGENSPLVSDHFGVMIEL